VRKEHVVLRRSTNEFAVAIRLDERIGMKNVTLEFDGAGTFIGSSHVYAPGPPLGATWAALPK